MSDDERYGTRDLTWSRWHRYALNRSSKMIDLDDIEYCGDCRMPLALIEVARDVGQSHKNSGVTRQLARMLNVPGLVVLYTPSGTACVCRMATVDPLCDHGVSRVRWRRIHPVQTLFTVAPAYDFAASLDRLHRAHEAVHRLGESA